jgi:hypothetical protein
MRSIVTFIAYLIQTIKIFPLCNRHKFISKTPTESLSYDINKVIMKIEKNQ